MYSSTDWLIERKLRSLATTLSTEARSSNLRCVPVILSLANDRLPTLRDSLLPRESAIAIAPIELLFRRSFQMAPSLRNPPSSLTPAEALQLSQQAPAVLRSSSGSTSSSPLNFLFSSPGTADTWMQYENLLLSCLRTGDEPAARQCLERLEVRFGDDNERVMALKGLVKEAAAEDKGALEKVLKEYDAILAQNNTNIVCNSYA